MSLNFKIVYFPYLVSSTCKLQKDYLLGKVLQVYNFGPN